MGGPMKAPVQLRLPAAPEPIVRHAPPGSPYARPGWPSTRVPVLPPSWPAFAWPADELRGSFDEKVPVPAPMPPAPPKFTAVLRTEIPERLTAAGDDRVEAVEVVVHRSDQTTVRFG
jgi:hypothetical protein